jgi:hypothetical protein
VCVCVCGVLYFRSYALVSVDTRLMYMYVYCTVLLVPAEPLRSSRGEHQLVQVKKVQFSVEQATNAQRGSRCVTLLS